MDNGNSLVFWGVNPGYTVGGQFTEYDSNREIVHEGKFINCESPTYRVFKYEWNNGILSSDLDQLNFPDTEHKDSSTLTITLNNHSNESLQFNEFVSRSNSFRINGTYTIPPRGNAKVQVVFRPDTASNISDTLTIRAKGETHAVAHQISVIGKGYGYTGTQSRIETTDLQAFPVPFTNRIKYQSAAENNRITLTDLSGKIVWQREHPQKEGHIDTNIIWEGIYFLSAYRTDGTVNHLKIMKISEN